MLPFESERVRKNAREATTEDLLNRVTVYRGDMEPEALKIIEAELAPFKARPHWGKLFTMDPSVLRSRYEKYPDFLALLKKYDPQGKFRNPYLDLNIYGI